MCQVRFSQKILKFDTHTNFSFEKGFHISSLKKHPLNKKLIRSFVLFLALERHDATPPSSLLPTTSSKNFINVSNVFSSLNDYVNAGIDKGLSNINLNDQQQISQNDNSSHSSESLVENIKSTNNVKLKAKRPHPPPQLSPSSSGSNSTTQGSSRSSSASSSRRTTPTTSPSSSDDEGIVTKTNEKSLIPQIQNNDSITEDVVESVDQISADIQTQSNVINKTNTIFSSSSSYCYNEHNSSDVTFSNDIVSLNETSSLSSLVNTSHNEFGTGDRGAGGALKAVSEEINVNSLDIETIDRSSVLQENDVLVAQEIQNEIPKPKITFDTQTKPIGFESTMDDVSDTELESYLQELEFETNSVQQANSNVSNLEAIEEKEEKAVVEEKLDAQDAIEIEMLCPEQKLSESDLNAMPSSSSSNDDFKDKNIDNISQASTVECNEVVTSHTDLDDKFKSIDTEKEDSIKIIIPVLKVSNENETVSLQPVIPEEVVILAEEVVQKPPEISEEALNDDEEEQLKTEICEDVQSEETTELTNTTTPPKRPTSLNFPTQTEADDKPASPGQTPPSRNPEQSQLSSSSDDMPDLNSAVPDSEPISENLISPGLPVNQLGRIPPYWVPDSDALNCMQCNTKFSIIKRRHHCRACGKVLCSTCCSMKAKLEYLGDVEARICLQCDIVFATRERQLEENNPLYQASSSQQYRNSPDPNNPMEYCSRLPPHQQVTSQQPGATPFSVMVPVGVLKREGSSKSTRKEKNVIFSDGIRPGCDLTELDHNWDSKASSSSSSYGRKSGSKRVQTPPGNSYFLF